MKRIVVDGAHHVVHTGGRTWTIRLFHLLGIGFEVLN
jgi:hypothetical protein